MYIRRLMILIMPFVRIQGGDQNCEQSIKCYVCITVFRITAGQVFTNKNNLIPCFQCLSIRSYNIIICTCIICSYVHTLCY